ncbi:MAG TPA: thiosulfate oxidation carrier protein SoxY [Burkholderiales bacterium]|nr:thiosulfate oxidation carrier protein SoxY [Burkholderiales bacterium]
MRLMRRVALRRLGTGAGLCAAALAGLLRPLVAVAAQWNKTAFEAQVLTDALKELGLSDPEESADIVIKAPEIAENGAQVPIELSTRIPGAQAIYIFVDKNPQPFAASFSFMDTAEPFVSTRIKMAETSMLRVIVRAAQKHYVASREVKVTIGGCGE